MEITETDISEFCDQHDCIPSGYRDVEICAGCRVRELIEFTKSRAAGEGDN